MRHNVQISFFGLLAVAAVILTTGCEKDGLTGSDSLTLEERGYNTTIGYVPNTPLVGLTTRNELASLISGPPARELSRVPISGLRDGENVLAIDTRPKTRELFGVTDQSMLYLLNAETGEALPVSGEPLNPAVNGKVISFDFNPQDDLIRLTTEAGQNLRISPVSGAVVGIDLPVNFGLTALNSTAYSYVVGSGRSILYGISVPDGTLYMSGNPNSGTIQYVGSLGYELLGDGGFEITTGNAAFTAQLSRRLGGGGLDAFSGAAEAYRLFLVNLKTGATTNLGEVKDYIGLAQRG